MNYPAQFVLTERVGAVSPRDTMQNILALGWQIKWDLKLSLPTWCGQTLRNGKALDLGEAN
jgi:hypothetical protein